jgi:MtN3 and saliva related transmembrane protein
MIELFGYVAGTLTTISFLPQVLKSVREKNVNGLSLAMYICFTTGVAFWLIYGILIGNTPIIIFNIITLLFAVAIIYNIIKYK